MFAEPTMLGVTVYDVTTGKGHNLPIGGQDGQNSIAGVRPPPVAFHPAKPELLAIVSGSAVELWNPEDPAQKRPSWRSPQHVDASEIAQLAFSPNGNYIAVWGTFGARILSADTGDAVAFLGDHESGVSTLRFDPDGRHVATVGRDRDHTLRIWTLEAALPVQNVKTDPIPAPGGRPRPQPGAESMPPSITLGDGRLRIEVVQAPRGGDTRALRDAAGEAASLLVYRTGRDQQPVAALHGPWRRATTWLSVRLDSDGNVVGLTDDGNQYTWRYFADRAALLSFAEVTLDQLRDHSKESAEDVEPTASEGCLLEPVGGNCPLGEPENP
jgi:WD40 repeat protein